jgi:hypothetical protein
MLAIDGQLREPGAGEDLMRYALERLQAGIDVDPARRPAPARRVVPGMPRR